MQRSARSARTEAVASLRALIDFHAMGAQSSRMRRLLIILVAMIPAAASAAAAPLPTTLTKLCGGLPYLKGDVVQFHASDGVRLGGAIAGPKGGRVGVVFANTADGGICDWVSPFGDEKVINGLAAAGDQVLLFHFRGTCHS